MDKNHEKTLKAPQVDANRRRLTKAGLAAPAILGVLASRPVLANVPWKCTVSGQISGNVSGHESESCTTLGDSQSTLAAKYAGPSLKNKTISYLFPTLTTIYFHWDQSTSTVTSTAPQPDKEAAISDILAQAAPSGLEYAKKALVLLLNAKGLTDTSNYPLTEYQAKNLFIAAATGGNFVDTNPDVNWSPVEYKAYIGLLWRT